MEFIANNLYKNSSKHKKELRLKKADIFDASWEKGPSGIFGRYSSRSAGISADVDTYRGLHCSHMPEDPFSRDA